MTKWQMNRAGLLSFWYYDDEIFEFADGKLLLRGTNGSGKSVTMQSFIPVLLDGKKSPDRLDPFGSKARKMSDYLLGEEEISGREERTGYLFLEYKMAGTEQYVTTGIGMQARRHKDLKSWYFVITDNRRIGIDIELAHRSSNEIIPFSQKELTNRIGVGGVVTDSQKEYAELVNKRVFGFETMDAYEDLVKLLIQLRAPKLSKDFKPTVLYEILESALPPITDDELRHLSDSIESMDQTQQQLEQLTLEYEANQKILKRYNDYNQFILVERAERVIQAKERLEATTAKKHEQTTQLQQTKQTIEQLEQEFMRVTTDLQVANKEKESLSNHKVWAITKQLRENEEQLQKVVQNIEKLQQKKDSQERKRIEFLASVKEQEDKLAQKTKQRQQIVEQMQSCAVEADFTQHALNIESLERQAADFNYWKQEVSAHKKKLNSIKELVSLQLDLQEKEKELARQSSDLSKEIDLLQKELNQAEHWFDEELHKLKTALFTWMESYEEQGLHFTKEQQQRIAQILEQLYEQAAYHEVTNVLMDGLNEVRAKLKVGLEANRKEQQQVTEAIREQQQLLEKLKAEELAQPERMPGTLAFREQLTAQNIPHVPFYEAVEFQSHVTEEQKARIEAALIATGILDSLISPQSFDVQEDACLIANPKLLGYTLADFLQPDVEKEGISNALVDEILHSIAVEASDDLFAIDEAGRYRIGIVSGHAPEQGPSKYIGRTSRKRYQQEQIRLVEQTIEQLQDELNMAKQQQLNIEQQLAETKQWEAAIPSDQTLHEIDVEMRGTRDKQKRLQMELHHIDVKWKEVHERLKEVRQQLYVEKETINIAQTKEALNEALDCMDDYLAELNELQRVLLKITNAQNRTEELRIQIEDIDFAIDELHGELIDGQEKQQRIEAEIQSQQQQLQLEGADAIQQRIEHVQRQLTDLDKREKEILKEQPRQQANYETIEKELQQLEVDETFAKSLLAQWQRAFKDELELNFVKRESDEPKVIVQQFKTQQEGSKLHEHLMRAINEQGNALAEYNVKNYVKETELLEEFEGVQDDRLEPFKQLRGRRIVELDYRGQRVSPYHIDKALRAELEDSRHYLDVKDRELYEEIIVNSVGRILRQRIARAEQWVKEMDKIMAERDNSSGLIFSVSWKPRTAEAEAELDTKELVQLLQRKSSFLSETDLQKITMHFRSRIESAKESIGLRNEGNTLRQVLKEVLDYRKWFSFVLSYTRQNETKKELTNNAFYKFSGGEKAMAMYIPLFTAAYSRYKEADPMAPYIISLDEAFAGVDDQNIRDMFEVVEQLGFNYIMNSQAIWGDCDTVPSLAIAELVRPKNADYVTVLNYRWNGKERVLIE